MDLKGGIYCVNTAYIIGVSEKYLLGILNSNLMNFIYRNISSTYRGGYLRYIYQYMAKLPIVNLGDGHTDKEKTELLVDNILNLYKSSHKIRTPQKQTALQRQIDEADKQIDQLVYSLYGLTEEEIKIVEGE